MRVTKFLPLPYALASYEEQEEMRQMMLDENVTAESEPPESYSAGRRALVWEIYKIMAFRPVFFFFGLTAIAYTVISMVYKLAIFIIS